MRFLSSLCFTQALVYWTSQPAYASSQFAVSEHEGINAPHTLTADGVVWRERKRLVVNVDALRKHLVAIETPLYRRNRGELGSPAH